MLRCRLLSSLLPAFRSFIALIRENTVNYDRARVLINKLQMVARHFVRRFRR